MSTMPATYSNTPIFNRKGVVMPATNVRPPLNEIVRRVRALRALSKATGFSTNRTVGEMLEKLSQDELVSVGEVFLLNPDDNADNK